MLNDHSGVEIWTHTSPTGVTDALATMPPPLPSQTLLIEATAAISCFRFYIVHGIVLSGTEEDN